MNSSFAKKPVNANRLKICGCGDIGFVHAGTPLDGIEKLDPWVKRQITKLLDDFIGREKLKQRVDAQESRR